MFLLLGPTGKWKNFNRLEQSQNMDVPFAIADATSLTEARFYWRRCRKYSAEIDSGADGDIEKAERGIIFLDRCRQACKTNVGTNITKRPVG